MKKNHYIYYSYEEFGRGYIGKRSCKCEPENDVKYFGSYRDKTFKPTQKIILETFETAEGALAAEIMVQKFFRVAENPHFVNQVYQTSTKFTGTSETIRKVNATMTPEQRSERSRKARRTQLSLTTSEQRSESSRKARLTQLSLTTPEQLSERSRKARLTQLSRTSPEQRSESSRKARRTQLSLTTSEQRSESSRKARLTQLSRTTPEQLSERTRKARK